MHAHCRQWVHVTLFAAAVLVLPASAGTSARAFPELIALPADFGPEGIASGNGTTFYAGSLGTTTRGQILVGDLRTGQLAELVPADGVPATGIKHDARSNLLFVARAASGTGTVFDAGSGDLVAGYEFQTAPTFVNDVVVTRDAAYFTDTAAPFLYRVALGPRGRPAATASRIPLPGDFRTNGVAATPNGEHLLVVNAADARLYRFDTATSAVVPVDLGGETLPLADGLLLRGKTLYVVQNRLNRVAVVELSAGYVSGAVTRVITEPFASNPLLQVPTTIAAFGDSLYAVTAGFAPPAPDFVVRLAN
jgi:DNA-binding beta-propeller fold protein YncE